MSTTTMASRGLTYRHGEPGYEGARRSMMWNTNVPHRFPDVIVQANDEADAVAAVTGACCSTCPASTRSPLIRHQ